MSISLYCDIGGVLRDFGLRVVRGVSQIQDPPSSLVVNPPGSLNIEALVVRSRYCSDGTYVEPASGQIS